MLAVCIPIYNQYVDTVVAALQNQISQLSQVSIEIICIDDGSEEVYRIQNRKLSDQIKYLELEKNVGRSAIRNAFLEHTSASHLLFIDGDSLLSTSHFLSKYITLTQENPNRVICGGRLYPESQKSKLRYQYFVAYESKSNSFVSCNFVIPSSVFKSVRFDETIKTYGHEDTLFGIQLRKANEFIDFVDNPVINNDVEEDKIFIDKSEIALTTLKQIVNSNPEINFNQEVRLVRYTRVFTIVPFNYLFRPIFRTLLPIVKNVLLLFPDPTIFQAYKLMYYSLLK